MISLKVQCTAKELQDYFSYNEKTNIDFEFILTSFSKGSYVIKFNDEEDATAFKFRFLESIEYKEPTMVIGQGKTNLVIPIDEKIIELPWYKKLWKFLKNVYKSS